MRDVPAYGRIDHDYALRLASSDDGPIYMLNLMAYKPEADYGPGGERGVTGREADDRYAPLDVLAAIGAAVVYVGDVVASTEPWDRVAVVRYPTRRSFVDMQSRPDFQDRHVHKEAGMDRTIILGTVPVGGLPPDDAGADVLIELSDDAPEDGSSGDCRVFAVEGTIVGDGRPWKRVSWSRAPDRQLPPAAPRAQALVVRTALARWS